MHYRRVLRTGNAGPAQPRGEQTIVCKAPECEQLAEARGYCHGHSRGTDPLNKGNVIHPMRVKHPLTRGFAVPSGFEPPFPA